MTADDALGRLAQAHGIHLAFHDLQGERQTASPDTLRALLAALGVDAATPALVRAALGAHQNARHLPEEFICRAGEPSLLPTSAACTWTLLAQNGAIVAEGRAEHRLELPPLPIGYFDLCAQGANWEESLLILSPPAAAPALVGQTGQPKTWGMTGALYGLRSAANGGLGNFADLGRAATHLGHHGAQFLGINPVHALGWARTEMISPYSPTHRGFLNIDHIAVPGGLGPTPRADLVDYPAYRAKHRAALKQAHAATDEAAFARWRETAVEDATTFAQFEAISECHGADFRAWPAALQRPGPAARKAAGKRTAFHLWLQWQAETQVAQAQSDARAAGMSLGLYLDLAVGPRPDGAEVWMHPDTIARGVTIGAPPDHLSPHGQSWRLAAHGPGPLRMARYVPLRRILRKSMRHCGLLRIDHALGLLRSFWIPDDGSPGGYVTQPFDALLAVIAIEAAQAGCIIVGEDLGLVPEGFRERMNAAGLLSYAVWQYETKNDGSLRPASRLPPLSLACFGTHDTPTLRGFWYGQDIEWWHRVGWQGGPERHAVRARQRASLRDLCGIAPAASADRIGSAIHSELARAPSALVSVQLEDAFGQIEAQNLPGTIDAHPNWRRRLPVSVEDFTTSPQLRHVAELMPENRRAPPETALSA